MKHLLLLSIFFSVNSWANSNLTAADDLFNKGLELIKERNSKSFVKGDDDGPEIPGGLIKRHPLLNNARRLFKDGKKNPSPELLRTGDLWTCLKFSGLDFNSELMPSTVTRGLNLESFGTGIFRETSYGNNIVKMYALDKEDLAGINDSADLYEAIRVTAGGDLILESSVQGTSWWEKFFTSIMSAGKDYRRILKIVSEAMITSISDADNNGLVFDYTVCPGSRVIEVKK